MNYAVINKATNVVENIVVLDATEVVIERTTDFSKWQPPENCYCRRYYSGVVEISYLYDPKKDTYSKVAVVEEV